MNILVIQMFEPPLLLPGLKPCPYISSHPHILRELSGPSSPVIRWCQYYLVIRRDWGLSLPRVVPISPSLLSPAIGPRPIRVLMDGQVGLCYPGTPGQLLVCLYTCWEIDVYVYIQRLNWLLTRTNKDRRSLGLIEGPFTIKAASAVYFGSYDIESVQSITLAMPKMTCRLYMSCHRYKKKTHTTPNKHNS